MSNILFFLVIPFFLGLALHWLLVLFYKIGLGFITRFFYRGVFIFDDTLFHQDILWNKPQIRIMLALLPCLVFGVIFSKGRLAVFWLLHPISISGAEKTGKSLCQQHASLAMALCCKR